MANSAFHKGDTVHGWRLRRRLGSGGSGEVWKAYGRGGKAVALKILVANDLPKIIRFVREIEIMDSIRSDISMPILDQRLPGAGPPPACYAMPLATPLRALIAARESTPLERIAILAESAACLSLLHERGVFHCDVKTGNILRANGRWVLGDFGLSMRPRLRPIMAPDEIMGTRYYTAPELYGAHDEDYVFDWAACDVYSFAKVIWVTLAEADRPMRGPYDLSRAGATIAGISGGAPGASA
ncbi:MAG: protein kinase domain-containing protein, partial [Rhodospirillales bacterium]